MDQRLEKALDFSNYMVTLNNQKRVLTEQFKQDTFVSLFGLHGITPLK